MSRSLVLLAVAGCALLSACATTSAEPSNARLFVTPSKSLRVTSLRAERRDGVLVVRGRVARRSMMTGAVWGHLHVEAVSNGTVAAWADTRWSRLSKRRLPTSYFQVRLPATAAPIDEIHVSHVQQGHGGARKSGNPR